MVATTPLTLEYVKTIGIYNNATTGRGFFNPCHLAVSGDGRIFVLNRCDPIRGPGIRIGICNLDGDYLAEFGKGTQVLGVPRPHGDGDGQFVLPVAMAFDSQDRLHITDEYNHRVSVFDSSGVFLHKWGVYGDGEGQLNGPAGIAFDSQDNAYVVDQHNHRVQKFTSDGEYLLQWGERGVGDGQFHLPWGVATDASDRVYVADWRNDRIQQFTPRWSFRCQIRRSRRGIWPVPSAVRRCGRRGGLHLRGRLG